MVILLFSIHFIAFCVPQYRLGLKRNPLETILQPTVQLEQLTIPEKGVVTQKTPNYGCFLCISASTLLAGLLGERRKFGIVVFAMQKLCSSFLFQFNLSSGFLYFFLEFSSFVFKNVFFQN